MTEVSSVLRETLSQQHSLHNFRTVPQDGKSESYYFNIFLPFFFVSITLFPSTISTFKSQTQQLQSKVMPKTEHGDNTRLLVKMSDTVSCVAVYDYHGDPSHQQLAFPRDALLQISRYQQPQNGWLWGAWCGRKGWFPTWAVDYQPPPPSMPPPPRPEGVSGRGNRSRLSPILEGPSETQQPASDPEPLPMFVQEIPRDLPRESDGDDDDSSNGFDLSKGIMGGQIPRSESVAAPEEDAFAGDVVINEKDPKTSRRFLGMTFGKQRVKPFYQQKAQEPDWTATPQIIYDGKVIQEYSEKKRGFFQLHKI
jgi:hypothetical protein